MAIVKINAIEVDPEHADVLEERFRHRASAVEKQPGFLGFELLRPVEGETRYFVYTRWETEEDFQSWVNGSDFARGHKHLSEDTGERPVAHGASVLSFEVVLSAGPDAD